jgi:phosphoenolpyruvate carboxylase
MSNFPQNNVEVMDQKFSDLSSTIRMLGDILGEVIIEQAGRNIFQIEETIRLLAKNYREHEFDWKVAEDLTKIISKLNNTERTAIIRSFSIFFQLVRVAEERYLIQANLFEKKSQNERPDTLLSAVQFAKSMGLRSADLIDLLSKIKLRLVFTAHPTEARRLTLLNKLKKIFEIIGKLDNPYLGELLQEKYREEIKYQITLIWQSDEIREEKVNVIDEVRSTLFYFDNVIFDTVPLLYENFRRILAVEYANEFEFNNKPDYILPSFIEFGSWVGGDRDGHPGVNATISYQTLLLQKRMCLRKYKESIRLLMDDLSSSTNFVEVTPQLLNSIENDNKLFPEFSYKTSKLNKNEPYRRKLDLIRLKLENTLKDVDLSAEKIGIERTLVGTRELDDSIGYYYRRSGEFLADLRIIQNSLKKHKGKLIANGKIRTLINQVRIFGFHMAPLDFRQDSTMHRSAINEIFIKVGLKSLDDLSVEDQINVLNQELLNQRPLGAFNLLAEELFTNETTELLSSLILAKEAIFEISPRSVGAYIISMCKSVSDILIILLLFKEVGIVNIKDKVKMADLDIVPLFETKGDLLGSPDIMETLFNNPIYRSYISARGNLQEIMLGYSDSSKDVGYFESNNLILNVQLQLVELAKKHKIRLRFFHGRGGSISRGGGSTNKSILSQPPGTSIQIKITEQGEMVAAKYANSDLAYRNMEHAANALIIKNIQDKLLKPNKNPGTPPENYLKIFKKLAEWSQEHYNSVVKDDSDFINFYEAVTPLDLVEKTMIGSRPTRRKSEKKSITDLRAIPWVFSWTQMRILFPGFFSTGYALNKAREEYGIDILQKMYKNWYFFTSLIDNLQMVLSKVDITIGSKYIDLCEDESIRNKFLEYIKSDFNNSFDISLKITDSKLLLDHYPTVRNSIIRRIPYIDPLSVIQIELLKVWRNEGRPEDLSAEGLLRSLLYTVNGIAAGMKNTG